MSKIYTHLHLISDSTGETLSTISRAAMAQFEHVNAIEHVHPMVRGRRQLERAIEEITREPGMVLHTLVEDDLNEYLQRKCNELAIPSIAVLAPVFDMFQTYLNTTASHQIGGQHRMNAEYFSRIEALNFTMAHDDGHISDEINEADIIILGVSRTSKTPTSIYLANRGLKVANIPLVPELNIPEILFTLDRPFIVGLRASADHLVQIRQNRLLALNDRNEDSKYVERRSVAQEVNWSGVVFRENNWPVIDVTRRSIEETSAEILRLYQDYKESLSDNSEFVGENDQ